jgi:peptidoglycan/xylan/chitin deacetylase (PgdA/CDA1 family)
MTQMIIPGLRIAGALTVVACALVLGLEVVHRIIVSRRFHLFGRAVRRVETKAPVVALTFDDGPYPDSDHWREVLDILRQGSARATFFVVGELAEGLPAVLEAMVAEGHEVGNHTYTHRRMVMKWPSTIRSEIERTDALIRRAGQRGTIHFRPPFCAKLVGLPLYLLRTGRQSILWDVEPEDVVSETRPGPDEIARRAVEEARPGSIVLLHVMGNANRNTRAALPRIVAGLRERGFELVTVSELLASSSARSRAAVRAASLLAGPSS